MGAAELLLASRFGLTLAINPAEELLLYQMPFPVSDLHVPTGLVMSLPYKEDIEIWDFNTGASISTIENNHGEIISSAFSPDGDTLALGVGQRISLWQMSELTQVPAFLPVPGF